MRRASERRGIGHATLRGASLLVLLAASTAACATTATAPEPRLASQGPTAQEPVAVEPFRTIAPDEVVPPFHLTAEGGAVIDSTALVGKVPFIVFFFASWCHICDAKLPLLLRALARHGGQIPLIAVSSDDDDTWPDVPLWAANHQFRYPIVRGSRTRFTPAYNPFGGVPLLLVVGPRGRILEVQLGYASDDERRLDDAIELAREGVARPARPR